LGDFWSIYEEEKGGGGVVLRKCEKNKDFKVIKT